MALLQGVLCRRRFRKVANGTRATNEAGGTTLLTVLIAVAVLYFARVVLIPLALAVLLAFLLAPLVIGLRRLGLGRVISSVSVVLLAFVLLAGLGLTMASQLTDLAHKLPEYQQNINRKVESLRASGGGLINRVTRMVTSVTSEFTPAPSASQRPQAAEEKPVPVEIRRNPFAPLELIQKLLGSVLSIAVTAIIVIVFVIFILIGQDDLRDRLIRLGGARRVNMTTRMLDDAAHRVSRYLLAQLIVNLGYGTLTGIGVYFLGVPNPMLWGILAALLRYIPYLGIWIAAAMPAIVAFAVEPEWVKGPLVFAIYFGIDLINYNFVEPLFYGTSTGLSALAILVAAVFWTWLWGPVGLLLAIPLTVCVVVLGRHVPRLEFLSVMLSDEPVLTADTRFYQRMLAMDLEDATEIAEEFLNERSLEDLYDSVIVPALSMAEEDRHRGKLDSTRQQFFFDKIRALVEDLAESTNGWPAPNPVETPAGQGTESSESGRASSAYRVGIPALQRTESPNQASNANGAAVLCVPARDKADEIATLMLTQLLQRRHIAAKLVPVHDAEDDSLKEIADTPPKIACICAVPPFGYTHARHFCRRLQEEFSHVKRIAAVLTEADSEDLKHRQPPIPADDLATSLKQAVAQMVALLPPDGAPAR
ncbi:MAG: AI-2E family transporter [Verrucomicrobia bacterium]|nr:MAG: AI-2E family transporter [Verrucomicrobiota bacterium]